MKTFNYDLFKFVVTNRAIRPSYVLRLQKSIETYGYIEACPIVVNRKMEIIDGQHRFEACKALGLPIYYEITETDGNESELIRVLNANQTVWCQGDYIESLATQGLECFKEIVEFENRYKFQYNISLSLCAGQDSRIYIAALKQGKEIQLNPRRHDMARFLLSCKEYLRFYKTSYFVRAIVTLFKRATPEQCEKVLVNIQSLKKQVSTAAYLMVFENILNCRVKDERRKIYLTQTN